MKITETDFRRLLIAMETLRHSRTGARLSDIVKAIHERTGVTVELKKVRAYMDYLTAFGICAPDTDNENPRYAVIAGSVLD